MKLDKYTCDNQMDMFEFMNALNVPIETDGPPVLLNVGQIVYKVIRGDVKGLYVYNEKSWLCGDNKERGYRLKEKDGSYDCTWNSRIGVDVFTSQSDALEVAESYLSNCKCIRKENIHAVKTVAYSYIRECDKRTMIAFYSILDNEMIYVKNFMTFHHIRKDVNKAITQFMDQQEFKFDKVKEIEYQPVFKNMYQCKNDSGWCYAEAGYNHF